MDKWEWQSELNSSISSMSSLESSIPDLNSTSEDEAISDANIVQGKRPYRFHDRRLLEVTSRISESAFRQYFRMNKDTFQSLLDFVQPHLPDGQSKNGRSLTTRERLLMFLMFAASNEMEWTAEVRNRRVSLNM